MLVKNQFKGMNQHKKKCDNIKQLKDLHGRHKNSVKEDGDSNNGSGVKLSKFDVNDGVETIANRIKTEDNETRKRQEMRSEDGNEVSFANLGNGGYSNREDISSLVKNNDLF